MIGTVPEEKRINCWQRSVFDAKRFKARLNTCDCLAHEFARVWFDVTGDSWIAHAIPVLGGNGAGAYMGKYLEKMFLNEERENILGMERRWSSSRGWPGSGRLRLSQTDKGGWIAREWKHGFVSEIDTGGPTDLLERSGDNLTIDLAEKAKQKAMLGKMKRSLHEY